MVSLLNISMGITVSNSIDRNLPLYPMNLSEARIAYNFKEVIIHIHHLYHLHDPKTQISENKR